MPSDASIAIAGGGGEGVGFDPPAAERQGFHGVTGDAPLTHKLILRPAGREGQVPDGMGLLAAARSLGVELESICGGRQTCGKCQVAVEEGAFAKHAITSSADHLSAVGPVEADYCEANNIVGRRLACAAQVVGDLLIVVPEERSEERRV